MSPDDMQRFEVDAESLEVCPSEQVVVALSCDRCPWTAEYGPARPTASLAELVQRADEHTEVCR